MKWILISLMVNSASAFAAATNAGSGYYGVSGAGNGEGNFSKNIFEFEFNKDCVFCFANLVKSIDTEPPIETKPLKNWHAPLILPKD
ncbi:MAG: hypothetical protein EOP07_15645 [Proteobacteria bacterium]|nr:MAG: hypothetical protein EOP07_15645 [Pseudomonadota bacterium]